MVSAIKLCKKKNLNMNVIIPVVFIWIMKILQSFILPDQ